MATKSANVWQMFAEHSPALLYIDLLLHTKHAYTHIGLCIYFEKKFIALLKFKSLHMMAFKTCSLFRRLLAY